MATIGSLTKRPDGIFEGNLATLTMPVRLRPVPLDDETSDKAPDYRVYAGKAELGAAWCREKADGTSFLSVTLDDPSFARPIAVALL